ncbi:fimbrial protein [Buttiauxella selenatireducens]|uniref:Fimbrial protein n=1 Tax=Buttiauxella selenatireducens TaxID=3073902 RepID=A0ABY9SDS4_9ENTR|nr:fimbrial protein [Buttiauxella sp. R73]WMY75567.1 fimbrial protein [Buttiauxella sp. R73]
MSFNKGLIALALSAMAFSSMSMAAETYGKSTGTVDFTGNIVNTPCAITTANQSLKVDMGNIRASDFAAGVGTADSHADRQFVIVLSDCTVLADPIKATVTFGGLRAKGDKALATGTGDDVSGQPTAQGVGIQIVDQASGTDLAMATASTAVPITNTEMQLFYGAHYVSVGDVKPGVANGHATFSVAYN